MHIHNVQDMEYSQTKLLANYLLQIKLHLWPHKNDNIGCEGIVLSNIRSCPTSISCTYTISRKPCKHHYKGSQSWTMGMNTSQINTYACFSWKSNVMYCFSILVPYVMIIWFHLLPIFLTELRQLLYLVI